MKSTTVKKPNSPNVARPEFESELKFDSGITRAMLSGITRHTIRLGTRKFKRNIHIHGHDAFVTEYKHTSLLHADIKLLSSEFGFKSIFDAILHLQKYYPGMTINDPITIVGYRLAV